MTAHEAVAGLQRKTPAGRAAALSAIELFMRERMDRLRATADELRSGKINQFHAANRITKIANEIARGK